MYPAWRDHSEQILQKLLGLFIFYSFTSLSPFLEFATILRE
jgi:hypothetical protein